MSVCPEGSLCPEWGGGLSRGWVSVLKGPLSRRGYLSRDRGSVPRGLCPKDRETPCEQNDWCLWKNYLPLQSVIICLNWKHFWSITSLRSLLWLKSSQRITKCKKQNWKHSTIECISSKGRSTTHKDLDAQEVSSWIANQWKGWVPITWASYFVVTFCFNCLDLWRKVYT